MHPGFHGKHYEDKLFVCAEDSMIDFDKEKCSFGAR
jgi:hypothetical protein